jgi:hypothetical protein
MRGWLRSSARRGRSQIDSSVQPKCTIRKSWTLACDRRDPRRRYSLHDRESVSIFPDTKFSGVSGDHAPCEGGGRRRNGGGHHPRSSCRKSRAWWPSASPERYTASRCRTRRRTVSCSMRWAARVAAALMERRHTLPAKRKYRQAAEPGAGSRHSHSGQCHHCSRRNDHVADRRARHRARSSGGGVWLHCRRL